MVVSKNRVFIPKSSILIGFGTIIFTIHFGVPLFLETPTWCKVSEASTGFFVLKHQGFSGRLGEMIERKKHRGGL